MKCTMPQRDSSQASNDLRTDIFEGLKLERCCTMKKTLS
jgi:hypothetical protein